MLSRIAGNVYWVGRYVERVDDTVRLVGAHYYGQLQIGAAGEGLFPDDLLAVLGSVPDDGAGTSLRRVVSQCVIDMDNHSSVASCLRLARENARGSREVLPLELWETLSAATGYLDGAGRQRDAEELLREVPQWTRAFYGLVDQAMPRTLAWTALRLGMLVERADMTLRVLILASDALAGRPADDPLTVHLWFTALRACAALDAFRTATSGFPTGSSVAEVLLHDERCPRSVLFCVRAIESLVGNAHSFEGGWGGKEPTTSGGVGRRADRFARRLHASTPGALLEDGSEELHGLLIDCRELHESIADRYLSVPEAS